MNNAQKIIIAILTPIILFFIGIGYIYQFVKADLVGTTSNGSWQVVEWYDLGQTWIIWLSILVIIGIIEYFLFIKK